MYALIPSAGSGARLGGATPKQYLPLAGAPMLAHTARAFLAVEAIRFTTVLVQPGDARAAQALPQHPRLRIAEVGADTRAGTVRRGLEWLLEQGAEPEAWVLVHDAARCCITPRAIESLAQACADDAVGGLLALPLPDTLKRARDAAQPSRVAATVPREGLWLAQTPQMFRLGLLLRALRASDGRAVTDEASAVEALGLQPLLVPGSSSNFKVTYADDLALAAAVLQARGGIRGEGDD